MDELNDIIERIQPDKWNSRNFYRKSKFWIFFIMVIVAVVIVLQLVKHQRESISASELKTSLKIVSLETRWVNKEVTPYKVKIIPSVRFKIENTGTKIIRDLKFVGVFVFADSGEQMSDGVTPVLRQPMEPGKTSNEISIKALYGYAASSKAAFMKNREKWKKIKVKIFAKTNSGFAQLGIFPVKQVIEGIDQDYQAEGEGEIIEDEKTRMAMELGRSLQAVESSSIWEDKVVSRTRAIIVPVFYFKLKNAGKTPLHNIIAKGVFEFEEDGRQLTVGTVKTLSAPLGPGKISKEYALRGEFGFAASSKAAFIKNQANWKKVKVRLFVKSKQSAEALLGIYPVSQKIKGVKVVYRTGTEKK